MPGNQREVQSHCDYKDGYDHALDVSSFEPENRVRSRDPVIGCKIWWAKEKRPRVS